MDDFVTALRDIHSQFEWPMPVLSTSALNLLKKTLAGNVSFFLFHYKVDLTFFIYWNVKNVHQISYIVFMSDC